MIVFSSKFDKSLEEIRVYITLKDGETRYENFANELFRSINNIEFMPRKHRKNLQVNQENIRDLIFKGYTVPFQILENGDIFIITIFKQNQWDGKIN
ncbi:MAG: type II toxin-antitoxin system RelE/ParE family toxin [Campylobacteraceae bacterium]|nr:type II toxin-antitoxin system RelE/ParE family toxin [Campylobacteraceae bacterium]